MGSLTSEWLISELRGYLGGGGCSYSLKSSFTRFYKMG